MIKNIKNAVNHLKTICIHKKWVMYYCTIAGIPIQGLVHDLSKFSPTEFCESVKYYTGTCSPIDMCKKGKGVSQAWLHHKGKNKHHYEYWQDNFDKGGQSLQMPFKYAVEMVCDYLAAGRAYMKDKFSYAEEYVWWQNKISKGIAMHPQTKSFVDTVLKRLVTCDEKQTLSYDNLVFLYKLCETQHEM